jgi:membrane-associated phospholipid phosphatase
MSSRQFLRIVALVSLVIPFAGCATPPDTDPRMVTAWINTLYGMVRAERLSPPVASRILAYAAVAVHEGLAAATPGLTSAAPALQGLPPLLKADSDERYDATLIVVAAEGVVLDSLLTQALPTTQAMVASLVDSLRMAREAQGVAAAVRTRSEELGHRIGQAIVAWSRTDGFRETRGRPYEPPTGLGLWVNDSPAMLYAVQNLSGATYYVGLDDPTSALTPGTATDRGLVMNRPKPKDIADLPVVDVADVGGTEPYWGTLRPFILATWNECPIPDPPPYSTDPDSPRYQEARQVYDVTMNLTPEQRMIAHYWADNPGETATPAGHWLAIGGQLVDQLDLSVPVAARLMLVNALATADAFIATWGYKYETNVLRPRTYIRQLMDPSWEPPIPTPPFPDYPSGHSTQSGAASAAVIALLGDLPFEDRTQAAIGLEVRRFASFSEAAEEAGWSRIYGGIHYYSAKFHGNTTGKCIGQRIVERLPALPDVGGTSQ